MHTLIGRSARVLAALAGVLASLAGNVSAQSADADDLARDLSRTALSLADRVAAPGSLRHQEVTGSLFLAFQRTLSNADRPAPAPAAAVPDVGTDARLLRNLATLATSALADALEGKRLIGASSVRPGSYAEVVAIRGLSDAICSGVLIAPNAVLSAAHCDCGGINRRVIFDDVATGTADVIPIVRATRPFGRSRHREDCQGPASARHGHDAVAFILARVPARAKPVALATDPAIESAKSLRVLGYGINDRSDGGPKSGVKMMADIAVASPSCDGRPPGSSRDDAWHYGCVPKREIVAAERGLVRRTCRGDSGGPAFVMLSDGSLGLAGVTSRGIANEGACGQGTVFARAGGAMSAWLLAEGIGAETKP